MPRRRAHALAVIGRIELQELDRRRLELGQVEHRLELIEDELASRHGAWAKEAAIAQELPDGQRLMACFALADHRRRMELHAEKERLHAARICGLEAITTQRTIVRRWEILAERAMAEVATIDGRRAAAVIDELALLRHAHRSLGISGQAQSPGAASP